MECPSHTTAAFPWDFCRCRSPAPPLLSKEPVTAPLSPRAPNPDCAHPEQYRDYFNNPAMQETTSSGQLKAPKAPQCSQERGREALPGSPALLSLPQTASLAAWELDMSMIPMETKGDTEEAALPVTSAPAAPKPLQRPTATSQCQCCPSPPSRFGIHSGNSSCTEQQNGKQSDFP